MLFRSIKHLTAGVDEFEQTIKRTIKEYKAAGRRAELQNVIKKMRKEHKEAEPSLPADLCYVEGDAREQYLHDMRLCQWWAVLNRKLISRLLLRFFPEVDLRKNLNPSTIISAMRTSSARVLSQQPKASAVLFL